MLYGVALVLLVLSPPGHTEDQRVCYKCRAKDRCFSLDTSATEHCSPDVNYCVKKETFSRVTGAMVTERYCGGRDFLNSAKGLVEEKCYSDEQDGRRTSATICYCSHNYCNGVGPQQALAVGTITLWILITAAVL
ncbi:uncharacterized protein [Panulirus ornatus]|uniref:uncharacterized protein n=1 Tax=Panulirus ornatus TaxID=150431 RepID=UPI003A8987FE